MTTLIKVNYKAEKSVIFLSFSFAEFRIVAFFFFIPFLFPFLSSLFLQKKKKINLLPVMTLMLLPLLQQLKTRKKAESSNCGTNAAARQTKTLREIEFRFLTRDDSLVSTGKFNNRRKGRKRGRSGLRQIRDYWLS